MIGVFDSGSGGLTVLRAIRETMPSADVVYFADTLNAPYGPKSREVLTTLTLAAIERLQSYGASRIVSACNSVSASLAVSLYDTLFETPHALIEMVGPTVAAFRGSNKKILLCATEATINSEMYQNGFRMIGASIIPLAFPALAGAIEQGVSEGEIEKIISEALKPISLEAVDTAVLACTHYPLALGQFRKCLSAPIALYDPAVAIAARVKKLWWPQEVGNGTLRFLVSRESAVFRSFVERFFPPESFTIEVVA